MCNLSKERGIERTVHLALPQEHQEQQEQQQWRPSLFYSLRNPSMKDIQVGAIYAVVGTKGGDLTVVVVSFGFDG